MLSMFGVLCVVMIMVLVASMLLQLGLFHYRQQTSAIAAVIDITWNSVAVMLLLGLLYIVLQAVIF